MRFIQQPFAKPIILVIGLLLFSTSFLIGKNSKYRLIWNDAPATTMTIGWHQISGSNPTVFYDVVDRRASINSYAYSQKVDRVEWFRGMSNQFVRLKNLKPNTVYYFIIKDSEGISKRYWFKTAPNTPNERLSIISGGDSRNHRKSCQNANLLVSKLRPHLVMFGGDMTDNDTDIQWQDWLDDWQLTINADGQMFPIVPARGNHEYSNETIVKLFDAPNSSVYYGLNLGGNLLRAYTLNSLIASGGDQRDWLENDLRQHQNMIWRFAQYHHPIRPHTSRKSDKQELYNNWARLFYDYQMQLVMECDAHVCKTTYPIRPTYQGDHDMGFIRDDEKGTVYIGEGCWGAPLRPANDDKKWTRASGSFNEFKWIFVDIEKVEIRTIKTDNAASVGELPKNNIFKIPSGLGIWNPPTGSVIHIYNKTKTIANSNNSSKFKSNTPVTKPPKSNKPVATTTPLAKKEKVENPPKQQASKTSTSNATQLQLAVTDFDVSVEEEKVNIRWNTLSAPANTICEVQRAENTSDIAFQTIEILKIEEDKPNYQTYAITDNSSSNVQSPFAYYRLKCTSPNGSIYYSEKEVSVGKPWSSFQKLDISSDNWSVFLEYHLETIEDVTVSVFDSKGTPVSQNLYPKQIIGDHLKKIDVMFIRTGKYLIRLNIGKKTPIYFWFEKGA
jgi:hypothetical protein